MTVFLAIPVIRTVERIEHPSIRQLMTLARCSEVRRFMSLLCVNRLRMSRLLGDYFQIDYDAALSASGRFAQRALAAREAALLRCLLVIPAARAAPPIFPPRRPNSAMTREISDGPGRSCTSAGSVSILIWWWASWLKSGSGLLRGTFVGIRFQCRTDA